MPDLCTIAKMFVETQYDHDYIVLNSTETTEKKCIVPVATLNYKEIVLCTVVLVDEKPQITEQKTITDKDEINKIKNR